MKIGLCIVGCGKFAANFAESIQPLLQTTDIYFASRDSAKSKRYADMFNGKGSFGSYEEAAENPKIQAMYICTPHHLHLDHTLLAASNGKHVLLEKPIARSTREAHQIISAIQKFQVNFMVAENYRFMPSIRLCKQLVDDGKIGKIRVIQVQQESTYKPVGWRKDWEKNGGGVFIDAGIHKIHFLRYLLGDPLHIFATTPDQETKANQGEDGIVFISKWKTGEVALVYHSWTQSKNRRSHWLSLSGTNGNIYIEIGKPWLQLDDGNDVKTLPIAEPLNGLLPMTQEFLCSIDEHRTPEVHGHEALQDLIIVEKAYESINKGKSLTLTSEQQA